MRATTFCALLGLLLLCPGLRAQLMTLTGAVADTAGQPLSGATIILLRQPDSLLTHYALTDQQGRFRLQGVAADAYWLRISYLGFTDLVQHLAVNAQPSPFELGSYELHPASFLIQEIEVNAERIPIRVRGDTLEYDAQFFAVAPGETVEALLRRLPGLEIDSEGNISAQGEAVQRILVDGKEFFGDDPKLATRNLPATAINKVQLFDQPSEAERFTGLDDGRRRPTINLELKADSRKGSFGQLALAYGSQERYEADANRFRFREQSQLAFVGKLNNINRRGFTPSEYLGFMGGLQGGGVRRVQIGGNEPGSIPIAEGASPGFHQTAAAGINYNRDFGARGDLRTNYFYYRNRSRWDQYLDRQFPSAPVPFRNQLLRDATDIGNSHRLNFDWRFNPDSLQRISLSGQGWYSGQRSDRFEENTLRYEASPSRPNSRAEQSYSRHGQRFNGGLSGLYQRRLGAATRFLTLEGGWQAADFAQAGQLDRATYAYAGDTLSGWRESVEQRQVFAEAPTQTSLRLSVTEQWGHGWRPVVSFERRWEQSRLRQQFYDTLNAVEVLIPALSGAFTSRWRRDQPEVGTAYKAGLGTWTAALAWQHNRLRTELPDRGAADYRYQFWLPRLQYEWEPLRGRRLAVGYQAAVVLPTAEQLRPLADNSDPLRTLLGNPNLRPEYQHRLSGQFMRFDQFSGISTYGFTELTFARDKISYAQSIDSLNQQRWIPVNVDTDWAGNTSFNLGLPLRFLKSQLQSRLGAYYQRGLTRVNEQDNPFRRWVVRGGLTLENRQKEKVDLRVGWTYTLTDVRFAGGGRADQRFGRQDLQVEGSWKISPRWMLATDFAYAILPQTGFAAARHIPIWNNSLTFRPTPRLSVKLTLTDALDQNQGIERLSTLNYIQEEVTQSLGRYALLGIVWR